MNFCMRRFRQTFFDFNFTGHHGEYFENIISCLPTSFDSRVLLILPVQLKPRVDPAITMSRSAVTVEYLQQSDIELIHRSENVITRGRRAINLLDETFRKNGYSTEILTFLQINDFQLSLAKWRPPYVSSINGILFNPPILQRRLKGLNLKVCGWIKAQRKLFQLRVCLRNPLIDQVFILNDESVVEYLNCKVGDGDKFSVLVDPLPRWQVLQEQQSAEPAVDAAGRLAILMFGSITPRKGCLAVIAGLRIILSKNHTPVVLRIVGKFKDGEYFIRVRDALNSLGQAFACFTFELRNEYVDGGVLVEELRKCSIVMMPYGASQGSSGVLGHACAAQRPVICAKGGYVGEIVERYRLGVECDPDCPETIAKALYQLLSGDFKFSPDSAKNYASHLTVDRFCKKILVQV